MFFLCWSVPVHSSVAHVLLDLYPPLSEPPLPACRYTFTIFFNIYNKQLLKMWMMPITATAFQFLVGGILGLGWFVAARRPIIIRADILRAIFPLAVVHVLANTLTNLSLGLMAVSFTHTVKAMEPFFSVLLSMLFLHERPHPIVLLTLLPIVVGVPPAAGRPLPPSTVCDASIKLPTRYPSKNMGRVMGIPFCATSAQLQGARAVGCVCRQAVFVLGPLCPPGGFAAMPS